MKQQQTVTLYLDNGKPRKREDYPNHVDFAVTILISKRSSSSSSLNPSIKLSFPNKIHTIKYT